MRKTPHQEQQGFLTIAQNTSDVDYLRLAYLQAINIKNTQKTNRTAVIVDSATFTQTQTPACQSAFDYILLLDQDDALSENWKLSNEWQVFWLTPFKETIKVESDLLFTRSIDHWWSALRNREIVLSHGCKDYQGQTSSVRKYRRVFDSNTLPDIYNGLMYFRYSSNANKFFTIAKGLFKHWETVRDTCLVDCRDKNPTTDVVYALAANLIGRENCTIPTLDFFNFVHMKPAIQGWSDAQSWLDHVIIEHDDSMIRVNNLNQYYPFHYQDKRFLDGH